ncbi:hypothetical protein M9Y10_008280 [Tritrichomonas musculus]|uniref:RING-type domain-containing protein n=1 Tax=Tritrichomonas musculus TaxID=1915356 RepID=A0ABR2IYT0_9EUKA
MGLTLSSVTPNAASNEVVHNIYKRSDYKWNKGQIAANIRNGIVTPIYPILDEDSGARKCFCPICYNYYAKINETTCCEHGICTECLSAIIPPPPQERMCPFCRSKDFKLRTNVDSNHLVHKDDYNSEPPLILDSDLPDEINCILLQYDHLDKNAIIELYKAGLSAEEILSGLNVNI